MKSPKVPSKVPSKVLLGKGGASAAGYHKIETAMRCMKEYQFQEIRGLRKPTENNPDYFSVGSLFHAGRARWFSLNFATGTKAWASIKLAMEEEALAQEHPVTAKAEKDAALYIHEYIEHYKLLPKPRPIAAEYLLDPGIDAVDDGLPFYRTAKLDDVSYYDEAQGQLCIGESKTTGAGIADCILQYRLHGQPLLQYILWKISPQGEAKYGPVAGTILDITKKGYGKPSTFARHFMPFEDKVIKWFTKSMQGYLQEALATTWDSDAPRNIASCSRMGGRGRVACPYADLCMYGRSASIKYVLKNGKSLTTWKPTPSQTVPPWK